MPFLSESEFIPVPTSKRKDCEYGWMYMTMFILLQIRDGSDVIFFTSADADAKFWKSADADVKSLTSADADADVTILRIADADADV